MRFGPLKIGLPKRKGGAKRKNVAVDDSGATRRPLSATSINSAFSRKSVSAATKAPATAHKRQSSARTARRQRTVRKRLQDPSADAAPGPVQRQGTVLILPEPGTVCDASADVAAAAATATNEPPAKRARRSSALTVDRPSDGAQFRTTVGCKYYGSAVTRVDDEEGDKLAADRCAKVIAQVMRRNSRQHVGVELRVTDRGCTVTDVGLGGDVLLDLDAGEILTIVPGTLTSRSGRAFTVAVVVEREPVGHPVRRQRPCHLFQFLHAGDAEHVHLAKGRMRRDRWFREMLDVVSEADQASDGVEAMIERDMALVERRIADALALQREGGAGR